LTADGAPPRRPTPPAAAAQPDQADLAADGYAALFAEADRAADREREQPALFATPATAADVAAARPLRDAATGGTSGDTAAAHTENHAGTDNTCQRSRLRVLPGVDVHRVAAAHGSGAERQRLTLGAGGGTVGHGRLPGVGDGANRGEARRSSVARSAGARRAS